MKLPLTLLLLAIAALGYGQTENRGSFASETSAKFELGYILQAPKDTSVLKH